ncbi:hypothetical protein O3G_MSEX011636 [Manduca sexta]|uniref:PPIase cyclophilin-type domain-containing protein n=1 Tax=Manduca sexta TaxID=7130 RepID=A0A921ZKV0_MANSE|nr:hypothetical protein O3G_MSEX011636 [Manduca sexta]KAG6459854.1 hypothetical protein O3G_MSEX011636 [Manduca sexta]KAG6459855.1 hypothetical protein O3G_MSEX011636 [Manduca sexta]KAG6459856.1 hypothetical protein O3G_MSEX011636 [Manduca sexta]
MAKHIVDDKPPELFPELYLKPRRLDYYARQLEENMNVNKELLKRINLIQRTGGYVDCWMRPEPNNKYKKLLCQQRQRDLDEIRKSNLYFYSRLLIARSEQLLTRELEELWKDTKHKLILGATLPFILFKTEKLDRDIKEPAFDKPPNVHRTKVSMEIWVVGGSKIGKVVIELFNDLVPKTCQLFLTLVRGDAFGHAYLGTRFFRLLIQCFIVVIVYSAFKEITIIVSTSEEFNAHQPNLYFDATPLIIGCYKVTLLYCN